jgi:hypothetical protein
MPSVVEELQRDALDHRVRLSDLLRKAKTIAVKLDLPELEKWVQSELNGYQSGADVPDYRVIIGQLQGFNPFHGWRPVQFNSTATEQKFTKRHITSQVAELESLVAKSGDGSNGQLQVPLSAEAQHLIRNATGFDFEFTTAMSASDVVGILDAIRNALLDWSLKLEKLGVKGEGMSFSDDERKRAHETQAIYNIGKIETFTGNMGSGSGNFTVEGNTVNVLPKAAIESLVRKIRENEAQLGLEPDATRELHQALDGLQGEIKAPQPSTKRVNGFLASIRGIAEKAAGSLVAQGILYELAKLMHLAAHQ